MTLVLVAERSLPAHFPAPAERSYRLFVLQDGDGTVARAAAPSEILGLPLDPEGLAAALTPLTPA